MATVGWLVKGKNSGRTIITAPDAPADVATSVERLDLALDRFAGPMPSWYQAVQRTGYWWYPICMVVGVALALLVTEAPIGGRIAGGLGLGILLAPISGAIFGSVARSGARRRSGTTPEKVEQKVKGVARPIPDSAHETTALVLGRDPRLEPQVHDLLWRSTTGSDAVFAEIEALIAQVAPDVAAGRKAERDDLISRIDEAKEQGKF